MQLLNLELEGFGKFSENKNIDFDKGLNFITGMNESGKSTILDGIMASIFKYSKNQIEPFYCWNNKDVCKVSLTYKNDEEEIFKITSDYRNNIRKIEKMDNSKPSEFSSVEKNINPYIKKHFGFDDKKVFENTAFIKQSQMAILEDAPTKSKIKDMMEETLAGRAEVTATKTIKKIRKFAKDKNKEIIELKDEKFDLKGKFDNAMEIKSRVSKQSSNYEQTSEELKQKKEQLDKLDKNKKLFDEKEKLIVQKESLTSQMNNIDGFITTLNAKKVDSVVVKQRKELPVILLIIGVVIAVICITLSYPIVAIFGIPFIIYGLYKLIQKTETQQKPHEEYSKQIGEYQKQKTDLINHLAIVEKRLEEYKFVNFTIDDFRGHEELRKEVEELKEKQIELKTSVTTTTSLVESPEEIQEKIDTLNEKIEELGNKIEEHELAAHFLELAETGVYEKFTPVIEEKSKPILNNVTNNHYNDLKINEETLDVMVKVPEIQDYVDSSILSQGARDQVYFTLRTVMVNLLSGDINVPLILDDPFHNFDEIRLKNTIELVNNLSKEKQIILMSHRPYHIKFNNFDAKIIELK